jgi:hypothetical protein
MTDSPTERTREARHDGQTVTFGGFLPARIVEKAIRRESQGEVPSLYLCRTTEKRGKGEGKVKWVPIVIQKEKASGDSASWSMPPAHM